MNAVRGTLRVNVERRDELHAARPESQNALDRFAVTLRRLRDAVGGDEGTIVDPFGDAHAFSLTEWRESEAQAELVVSFSYQQADAPEGLRGTLYPPNVISIVGPP